VTERKVTNLAASIRQRLQNAAKASGRPFQEVAQYDAMERFLYRLSVSKYADKVVPKGALMLSAWGRRQFARRETSICSAASRTASKSS
jgi:hypothetical protein